ncbi:MAG: alpha-L-fucosidase [Victivallales bacterium]|nr:alpha-L-fucosidase [Victivallales bacterium]
MEGLNDCPGTVVSIASEEEEQGLRRRFPGYRSADAGYRHAGIAALERFWDMKFGLRIHWGLYSITGCGDESWSLSASRGGSPEYREQYEQLWKWWNPTLFNAAEWCDMMLRSGVKFFTFTTKHHDGFSLFDTNTRVYRRVVHDGEDAGKIVDCDMRYSIMDGPCKRDVTAELVAAGRERGLGIGLYFSHIDWFDSDFRIDQWNYQRKEGPYLQNHPYTRETDPAGFSRMIARHREQLRELCSKYGPIDLLSLDMCFPDDLGLEPDIADTMKLVRHLQPKVLVRSRGVGGHGDYSTPERSVPMGPENDEKGTSLDAPWKVIFPGSRHFSHVWHDTYQPAGWIVHKLVDIVAKGGVFQIGYGPMPDGTWAPQIVRRLEETGKWLDINGEGIYGTRPHKPWREGETIRYTRKKDGSAVYAFLLEWPGPPFVGSKLRLSGVNDIHVCSVGLMGLEHEFKFSQDDSGLSIDIPEWLADPAQRPCRHCWGFRMSIGKKSTT